MKLIRTISALAFALLVLVSSTSIIIGMHVCMGEVRNIAFFSQADACEKEQDLRSCHKPVQDPCCEDETVINQADDFKNSIGKFQIISPTFPESVQPWVVISEVIPSAPLSRVRYYNYDPPLRSWDLLVEHQVFLI
jgi:hypothetical protein